MLNYLFADTNLVEQSSFIVEYALAHQQPKCHTLKASAGRTDSSWALV